jgi:hypothetical protein
MKDKICLLFYYCNQLLVKPKTQLIMFLILLSGLIFVSGFIYWALSGLFILGLIWIDSLTYQFFSTKEKFEASIHLYELLIAVNLFSLLGPLSIPVCSVYFFISQD